MVSKASASSSVSNLEDTLQVLKGRNKAQEPWIYIQVTPHCDNVWEMNLQCHQLEKLEGTIYFL